MAFEIVMHGSLEKESDRASFTDYLRSLCETYKMKLEDFDTSVSMEFCPYGEILCAYEGIYISISAQSDIAGPGFHSFVCEFFEHLQEESPLIFDVMDETKYYEQRNFEDLKYGCYYPYLRQLFDRIEEGYHKHKDICIAWDEQIYVPKMKDNCIVTPLGYLSLHDIQNKDIEDLAGRFFIWNDSDKDAAYYRNCALALIWRDSFLSYSNMNEDSVKSAHDIINYLEAAYDKDNTIALPMEMYALLCDAIYRSPLIQDAQDLSCGMIGYRKEPIYYTFGNWRIMADGCCETSFDASTQSFHMMAPYREASDPWAWMIKANAYTFDKEVTTFLEQFEKNEQAMDFFQVDKEDVGIRGIIQEIDSYYHVSAQANSGVDTLFLETIVSAKEDVEKIVTWIKEMRHVLHKEKRVKHKA